MSDSITLDPGARRKQLIKTLAGFAFPLFFVIFFPLAYVSALHNPTPLDMPITVVGPTAVVGPIAESLDRSDSFTVAQTDVESRARDDVADRTSVGAILIHVDAASQTPSMTVYIASGGGRAAASAVQGAANSIAAELSVDPKVEDVAPLPAADILGTNLFYTLTYSSLGAYLLIVILTLIFPKSTFRVKVASVAGASVVVPLFVFGVMSIFVGDYNASFEAITGMLLVNALYVFTVGLLAILLQDLVGPAAILLVMGLVVFLNLPSSGGPLTASMLPPFWQWMHSFWFGAGALESFRSIIYFDGQQASRWISQLASWAVLITALAGLVSAIKSNQILRRRIDADHHRHLREAAASGATTTSREATHVTR